jgi:hypothetical protein
MRALISASRRRFIANPGFPGVAIATSVLARCPTLDAWPVWASLVCEAPASVPVARGGYRSFRDRVSHLRSSLRFSADVGHPFRH